MADFSEKTGEAEGAGPPAGGSGSGDRVSARSLAVAITDNRAEGQAPRIIAKGEGKVADQILEIAFARGVKVRTDQNLAQVLAAIEIDSEVPLQALTAVAEILTYVYRANGEIPPLEHGDPVPESAGESAGADRT